MNKKNNNIIKFKSISICFFLIWFCLVSSEALAKERFIELGDGTIQDLETGLIWASSDNNANINWSGAVEYCKNYSGGGYDDWRMPASNELASLYGNHPKTEGQDYSESIDVVTELIKISGPWVWTKRRTSKNKAMAYGFNYGITKRLKRGSGGGRRALPVRSGSK